MAPESTRPQRRCPGCGAETIKRSRRKYADHILSLFGQKPFRCRSCGRRFHLTTESVKAQRPGRTESRKRRRAARRIEALIYVFALVAFAVVAFAITQERG